MAQDPSAQSLVDKTFSSIEFSIYRLNDKFHYPHLFKDQTQPQNLTVTLKETSANSTKTASIVSYTPVVYGEQFGFILKLFPGIINAIDCDRFEIVFAINGDKWTTHELAKSKITSFFLVNPNQPYVIDRFEHREKKAQSSGRLFDYQKAYFTAPILIDGAKSILLQKTDSKFGDIRCRLYMMREAPRRVRRVGGMPNPDEGVIAEESSINPATAQPPSSAPPASTALASTVPSNALPRLPKKPRNYPNNKVSKQRAQVGRIDTGVKSVFSRSCPSSGKKKKQVQLPKPDTWVRAARPFYEHTIKYRSHEIIAEMTAREESLSTSHRRGRGVAASLVKKEEQKTELKKQED